MTTYKVFVDGRPVAHVATRENAEIIRDHWAGPNQTVQIVEVSA